MAGDNKQKNTEDSDNLQLVIQKLTKEKEDLQAALARQELYDKIMYRQWKEISEQVSSEEGASIELKQKKTKPVISRLVLSGIIIASMLVGAVASYLLLPGETENEIPVKPRTISTRTDTIVSNHNKQVGQQPAGKDLTIGKDSLQYKPKLPSPQKPSLQVTQKNIPGLHTQDSTTDTINFSKKLPAENNETLGEYKVKSRAYFHNQPDANTRRNAFIVHWNNAVLKPIDEQQGFVYVVFTNHLGQTSKGWLNKDDLIKLN